MIYLRLFWEFFKTGLFAVGGGMATLPFLKNIGLSTGWYSQTALMNMLAVSESTPGRGGHPCQQVAEAHQPTGGLKQGNHAAEADDDAEGKLIGRA